MATVKCLYCKNSLDKDIDIYVRLYYGQAFRYAHKECFDKQSKEIQDKYKHEVIDPADTVQCIYCKQYMNRNDFDCRPLNQRRTKFAHLLCIEEENKREKTPEEELDIYILKLFDLDYIPPIIQKQKKNFVEKQKLQYSGIKGTLKYFYEVKQNKIDKEHPTIGIVPYVYDEARKYYTQLALNKKLNSEKDLNHPAKIIEIIIKKPHRQIMKRKLFTFLDNEEEIWNE